MKNDFELFFQANERRIHFQIHRLGISGDLYAEFYAEGIVALWRAYKNYDANRSNLGTFLNYQIRFRLIDLLRKKKRDTEAEEIVNEEQQKQLHHGNRHRASGMPVADGCGIELKDEGFWEDVRAELSENQWKWVNYFIIYDLSIKEIMELEGVTADAVKGWGRAVRKKLRNEKFKRKLEEILQ